MALIKLPPCRYYDEATRYECKVASCSYAGSRCSRKNNQPSCFSYESIGGLGDLFRAVEDAGGQLTVIPAQEEGKPPYIAEILGYCDSVTAYGDSYEGAALAVINKVNEGSAKCAK